MPHRVPPKDDPDLLAMALGGDRDAVAAVLFRHAARVKRRYRARLNGTLRPILDADDVLAVIAFSLDAYVRSGRLAVESEAQLRALIFRIGDRAVSRLARQTARRRSPERLNDVHPGRHGAPADRLDLPRADMLHAVRRPEDRELLRLRLARIPYAVIAQVLGVSPAAARKRWQRLIADLPAPRTGGGAGRSL
ncbi:MAG: hypothetical protein KIS87_01240 [Phycisphaeraceae bacterium]|nr:hypothetical protein [Phycisphaeraceae bacterium]